jgi:hypothetical protein
MQTQVMSESDADVKKTEAVSSPGTSSQASSQDTGEESLPAPQTDQLPSSVENNNQQPSEPAVLILPADSTVSTPTQQHTSPPPIENAMDVHHHPHVHHSKKWKDYLFEFFMLFLAVMAGFFVENKREIYIEKKRAGQYSRQLLADLRSDSLLFENRNRDVRAMREGHKKLIYQLTQKPNSTDTEILETLLPLAFVFDFPTTATTYSQMKTSGALRYIENEQLIIHLRDCYDVLLPRCYRIAQASLDYYTANINPYYLKHIRIQDYDPFEDTLINKNALLVERTRKTDQELANIMGGYWSLLKIQLISMNEPALEKIKETMMILKEEYQIR